MTHRVIHENIPTKDSRQEAYELLRSRLDDMRGLAALADAPDDWEVIEENRGTLEGFGYGEDVKSEDDLGRDGVSEMVAQIISEWPLCVEEPDDDGWISVVLSTGGPHDEFAFRGSEVVFVYLPWFGREEIRLSGSDAEIALRTFGYMVGQE